MGAPGRGMAVPTFPCFPPLELFLAKPGIMFYICSKRCAHERNPGCLVRTKPFSPAPPRLAVASATSCALEEGQVGKADRRPLEPRRSCRRDCGARKRGRKTGLACNSLAAAPTLILSRAAKHRVSKDDPEGGAVRALWSILRDASPAAPLLRMRRWQGVAFAYKWRRNGLKTLIPRPEMV